MGIFSDMFRKKKGPRINPEMAKRTKELYPLGSIVLLKGGEHKLIITGIFQNKVEDPEKTYDYCGVPWPEGNMADEHNYLFFHENIARLVSRGYEDAEYKA